ncbi:MAG: peptidylprolyl isomerase [Ignavibacterium sp.]|nr:peptidylprolyl isomerase [Ignavibacterium sp.]
MAMMAKMRSLAPAFILTVGGLFVLFMVISDSNVLEALGGRTNNVGVVNGREISYFEFQEAFERQREAQQQQTGQDLAEDQIDRLRDQVWDALVTNILFQQMIDSYGLTVSDDEVRDIILGDNPPDFLKQNFIDSLGSFNRQLYEEALFDPRNREPLIQAEEFVRQNQLTAKLQSLIFASVTVGEDEVKRKFIDQNINLDVDYAFFDLNLIPDAEINVEESDLKSYYERNKNQFKVQPQRKLRYVLFPNSPSAEDSSMVQRSLQSILNRMEGDTIDFKELVEIYSDFPYSKDTLSVSLLTPEVVDALNKARAEDVVGPYLTNQGYELIKYYGSVPTDEVMARASHILINQFGDDDKNLEEANKLYNRLKDGADFAQAATELSQDPGSAQRGGDLGYFGKGMMVPEFENAVFSGKVGEVQKPVKTSFGYHIIKVTDRVSRKFVVERIVNQVKQSATTRDRMFTSAIDFAFLAKKNNFIKEAELLEYNVQETPLFVKTTTIPGLGANKRLIDFAFENGVNTISDPYKMPNGYVVVQIMEVVGEHFKPFEEVKEQIRPSVLREKKFEKLKAKAQDVFKKINGEFEKIPEILENVKLQQTGSFLPSGNIPGIGRDYAFVDKALNLEPNKVSEPFKGQRGYYIIKVLNRTPFDENLYDSQSAIIRNTILQEKRSRYASQWVEKLKENANIVDNRHIFLGQ